MSATNHTTNYELPIFVGSDKPAWLVDWNSAMTAIDTAIHTAEGKADQAGTDIGGIESSISTINSTLTSINNAVSQLRLDTNANTGSIHTIQELIGNGTPTTTDHTLIGAINEINAKVYDFNLQPVDNVTIAGGTNVTIGASLTEMRALLNAEGSVGKIYGSIYGSVQGNVASEATIATITLPGLDTETAYDVRGYALDKLRSNTLNSHIAYIHFNVGNTVEIRAVTTMQSGDEFWINLPPCLLFLENLGD